MRVAAGAFTQSVKLAPNWGWKGVLSVDWKAPTLPFISNPPTKSLIHSLQSVWVLMSTLLCVAVYHVLTQLTHYEQTQWAKSENNGNVIGNNKNGATIAIVSSCVLLHILLFREPGRAPNPMSISDTWDLPPCRQMIISFEKFDLPISNFYKRKKKNSNHKLLFKRISWSSHS